MAAKKSTPPQPDDLLTTAAKAVGETLGKLMVRTGLSKPIDSPAAALPTSHKPTKRRIGKAATKAQAKTAASRTKSVRRRKPPQES